MKTLLLKQTQDGVVAIIDGVKIEHLQSIKIEKTPDSPIMVELTGAIVNECQVDS